MEATQAYSEAWNSAVAAASSTLIDRADRTIVGHDRPRGWTLRRRSAAAR